MIESQYRVWCVVNPPSPAVRIPVESPEAASILIKTMALWQLEDDQIFMNAFGLEVFEDGEWLEWYNENGDSIDEAFSWSDEIE